MKRIKKFLSKLFDCNQYETYDEVVVTRTYFQDGVGHVSTYTTDMVGEAYSLIKDLSLLDKLYEQCKSNEDLRNTLEKFLDKEKLLDWDQKDIKYDIVLESRTYVHQL